MKSTITAKRLLVVDDDPRVIRLLLRVAKKLGFEGSAISNPADFDRAYEEAVPDVLLLDLSMPGVDGVELLRRLGERGSTSAIFVISGVDSRVLDTTILLGAELGLNMTGAFTKPIDIELLRSRLTDLRPVSAARNGPRCNSIDEASLRHAIESDELEAFYQPQVNLKSGKACGVEVLVRWRHPELGRVSPDRFIPLAEQTGLIAPLTYRVVEIALADVSRWEGVSDELNLAVNFSPTLLDDLELPDRLAAMLKKRRFRTSRLVLEVTETAAMEDSAKSMDILTRLRIKGFGLSIDDFGTGSSSLTQLYRLPYEEIKVDRSFVGKVTTDREAAAIVRSTIDLGHSMSLRVVAEGIEDQETLDWLVDLGCDIGQGYYLSKPISAEAFTEWLQEHS